MQAGLPFDRAMTNEEPWLYFVRHRTARRYIMRVDGDGRVRVTIPRGGSRAEADDFIGRHSSWIQEQRDRPRSEPVAPSDLRRLRQLAGEQLTPRLLELAATLGLVVTKVSIRNQRLRWGSCGPNGHICLNWRLMNMPSWVRDYVLIHELMHLKRQDHSPAYWRLVAGVCPGYEAARNWLRAHGRRLV